MSGNDVKVPIQGQPADVIEVIFDDLSGICVAGNVKLCESGYAGPDNQPQKTLVVRGKFPIDFCRKRSGADDAHIADQHVKELRKFIKMCFAQKSADRGYSAVIFRTGSAPGFVYMVRNL